MASTPPGELESLIVLSRIVRRLVLIPERKEIQQKIATREVVRTMDIGRDRAEAIRAAQLLLEQNPAILDTETTGLGSGDEVCEIAVIASDGRVLLDRRVCPTRPISADATRIHRITDADVADAPSLNRFRGLIRRLDDPHIAIAIYNAEFDMRIIDQSLRSTNYSNRVNTHCIMNLYAQYYGAWDDWHGSYTWQSLGNAARQCDLTWEGEPHTALSDARMALAVLRHIASR